MHRCSDFHVNGALQIFYDDDDDDDDEVNESCRSATIAAVLPLVTSADPSLSSWTLVDSVNSVNSKSDTDAHVE